MAQRNIKSQSEKAQEVLTAPVVEHEEPSHAQQSDDNVMTTATDENGQEVQAEVLNPQPTSRLPDFVMIGSRRVSTKPYSDNKSENAKRIKTDQDKIFKSGTSLAQDIGENALQCVRHVMNHGDTSLLKRLFEKLPPGFDAMFLKNWLLDIHAPLKITTAQDKSGRIENISMKKDMNWKDPQVWSGLDSEHANASEYIAGKVSEVKAERALARAGQDLRKPITRDTVHDLLGTKTGGFLDLLAKAMLDNGDPTKEQSPKYKGLEGVTFETLNTAVHHCINEYWWSLKNPTKAERIMSERANEKSEIEVEAERLRAETKARAEAELAEKDQQDAETSEEQPQTESGDVVQQAEMGAEQAA